MQIKQKIMAGWGNIPKCSGTVFYPETTQDVQEIVRDNAACIAFGNGRSYGDSALGNRMVSTRSLPPVFDVNPQTGVLRCGAGVLLADILAKIIPLGWTLPVLPGTRYITVGGAIAANVHGKNQRRPNLLSNYLLDFQLVTESGELYACSRTQHPAVFWNTIGGMGRTGIITEARLQLEPLPSVWLEQRTEPAANLAEICTTLAAPSSADFAVAWLHPVRRTGRVFFARYTNDTTPTPFPVGRPLNIPFFAPNALLNRYTMRLYHDWYAWRNRPGVRRVPLERYFFPLDGLLNWNRLYGQRGFVQYQVCFPRAQALAGGTALLDTLEQHGLMPFLVVIKHHHAPEPELVHGFVQDGFSLAIDLKPPRHWPQVVVNLDAVTAQFGGKIYAVKDASSSPGVIGLRHEALSGAKFRSLQTIRWNFR
jgi:decaprenylphospho-beta-D-ribofuranose 2-oxidase